MSGSNLVRYNTLQYLAHNYTMNLSPHLQPQSAFLQLPLEIRHGIYQYAFYGQSMVFSHGVDDVFARDRRYRTARRMRPRVYRKGLPYWIRSCKQITTEVLDLVARTWSFEAMSRGLSRRAQVKPDDAKTNPIVFSKNVLCRIEVRENFSSETFGTITTVCRNPYIQKPAQAFLSMLKRLQVQDATLELKWSRWWHRPTRTETRWNYPQWFDGEPELYMQDWDEGWYGRFRNVKIEVTFFSDPSEGDVARGLVVIAETCARRLVGEGGKASFQSHEVERQKPTGKIWLRTVTVERKV
jgi:hypothetical protein